MPRGVYERKSAHGDKKPKAKVKAKAKGKAAPKAKAVVKAAPPAVSPAAAAANAASAVIATAKKETKAAAAEPVFTKQDFRMAIDDMEPVRLKAYARSIGIMQRDVDNLTEDRLRQNCKARVLHDSED